ncbi:MAG: M24 family metallopeptidase [Gemmatales bacterium]|nr:M24 family metallopeptidase [Gemmatales bacterium]MDW8385466.1 M24 family metallopeptidase [Gemmatales bacterium]
MFDLAAVQAALRDFDLDGWLLADFRGSNVLARRIVDLEGKVPTSRRWFYFVPREGEPAKLVHRIEAGVLDHLPGSKRIYLRWQELEAGLAAILTANGRGRSSGARRLAMEYSPRNANPYVSKLDAGTVELVRGFGVEPVSSGDLIQLFEAVWDDEQWQMHLEASKHTTAAFDRAYAFIAERLRRGHGPRESDVVHVILDHFREHGLTTYHPPIVAVGPHSGDPHYETTPATDVVLKEGDFVLIDLWAKLDRPRAVYSDYTQVAYLGYEVPEEYERVFRVVAQARDAAIAFVCESFAAGRPIQGWQVDQAARDVIERAGFGEYFCHRTGHSIGQETHGNGANMDNLETHETRRVLPRTCFSIEPGIYLPQFGVRSEVNVFVAADGQVHVTGTLQDRVWPLLAFVK